MAVHHIAGSWTEYYEAFIEADTDHKIEIGGKGVGRFVCLKAFKELNITSYFTQKSEIKSIQFDFKSTNENLHDLIDLASHIHCHLWQYKPICRVLTHEIVNERYKRKRPTKKPD